MRFGGPERILGVIASSNISRAVREMLWGTFERERAFLGTREHTVRLQLIITETEPMDRFCTFSKILTQSEIRDKFIRERLNIYILDSLYAWKKLVL